MTAKKYCIFLISGLFIFICINIIMWYAVVKGLFVDNDLSRLGSFSVKQPKTKNIIIKNNHTEFSDYLESGINKNFDIITIGDSFSNGGGRVTYQDWLAEKCNVSILNISHKSYDVPQMIYALNELGYLDEIKPKFIILESVERALQWRFGEKILEMPQITPIKYKNEKNVLNNASNNIIPIIMFQANINFLYNKIYSMLNPGKLSPEVYITELNKNLFSNPGQENLLLFHHQDLDYISKPFNIEMVNRNLNNISKILKQKGIKLIFMSAVDKLDLYFPYIKDNKGLKENNFFDEFEKVKKDYIFINTKKIFRKMLENGEQDVYWLDDTHWSWKAVEAITDIIAEYII